MNPPSNKPIIRPPSNTPMAPTGQMGFSQPNLPPRGPMPTQPFGQQPRPPMMPTQPFGQQNRPPMMPNQVMAQQNRPSPQVPNAQPKPTGFGPQSNINNQNLQQNRPSPQVPNAQPKAGFGPQKSNSDNSVEHEIQNNIPQVVDSFPIDEYAKLNPMVTSYEELKNFYEESKYGKKLAQEYENYSKFTNPKIVYPRDELYSQLKYYDDLKRNENLNERQIYQWNENVNNIIKQIIYIDNYDFYCKHGYEPLSYNEIYKDPERKNVKFYQREDDIYSYKGYTNNIEVSIPKEKWWLTEEIYNMMRQETINENNIFNHPMFDTEVQEDEVQSNENALMDYPENVYPSLRKDKKNKKNKKSWFSKNENPKPEKFPEKQNPTAPKNNSFPKKENPTGPTKPTNFPESNSNTPKKGGFKFKFKKNSKKLGTPPPIISRNANANNNQQTSTLGTPPPIAPRTAPQGFGPQANQLPQNQRNDNKQYFSYQK